MAKATFEPDLTYTAHGPRFSVTINLPTRRLRPSPTEGATKLPDDGIVDEVAIERRSRGDMSVRLSPRELPCFVAYMAARGKNDREIGRALGVYDGEEYRGEDWANRTRRRYGIPAGRPYEPALQVDRIESNRQYNAKRRAKVKEEAAA